MMTVELESWVHETDQAFIQDTDYWRILFAALLFLLALLLRRAHQAERDTEALI